MRRTWMAAAGMALVAVAMAVAQIPSDAYTVDFRTKTPQFAIETKKGSTPAFVFSTYVGTTAWTGTGWTCLLKWGQSWDSESLGCMTGTVSSGAVTFQASATTFTNLLTAGYCALTASSNTIAVTFAEGTMTVRKAPEIP